MGIVVDLVAQTVTIEYTDITNGGSIVESLVIAKLSNWFDS